MTIVTYRNRATQGLLEVKVYLLTNCITFTGWWKVVRYVSILCLSKENNHSRMYRCVAKGNSSITAKKHEMCLTRICTNIWAFTIFIHPSLDGTYYGIALAVLPSVRHSIHCVCNNKKKKKTFWNHFVFGYKVYWNIFAGVNEIPVPSALAMCVMAQWPIFTFWIFQSRAFKFLTC